MTTRAIPFDQCYIVNADTGCWEWSAYRDRNGYGRYRVVWAHRYSYENHKGPIPERYEIDHLCENPPCVNPDHLEAVSKAEHCRRTMERLGKDDIHLRAAGLRAGGLTYSEIADVLGYAGKESAHCAVQAAIRKGLVDPDTVPQRRVLDEQDRSDIRALYALGVPQTEIGRWYETDSSQISRICNNKTSRTTERRVVAA